ncbi:MAG: ATP-grasp domain-containing protein [Methylococcales bacterium]|nr:ATP-grasp domain-containing protein [Methylococcales bacterium]
MKILVFEYITGGGFNKQQLSGSLAIEGRLMLQALLDNLSVISGIELVVMLDSRINGLIDTTEINAVIINPEHESHEEFARLAQHCDAVWPIAPENILQTLCQTVEPMGKILLTSPARAVAIAGNKLDTYLCLKRHDIATVATWKLKYGHELIRAKRIDSHQHPDEWIIKPVDGAGCADSYLITGQRDLEFMDIDENQCIIQPHIQGKKTSLSCLFRQGSAWLLCANLQQFNVIDRQYHLAGIVVNHHNDSGVYRNLINNIAKALPELWGYVGIDLIETTEQRLVLEINPRLTTSFAGIYAALGINVAETVLQLLKEKPRLNPLYNRQIAIKMEHNDAD